MSQPGGPVLKLRLATAGGEWIGPGKADLLQHIAETGSIAAAGRRMGMSYNRAWGLVETLNAMFAGPLVVASRGGAGRGGAELTDDGAEILRLYRVMQDKAEVALEEEVLAIARRVVEPKRK